MWLWAPILLFVIVTRVNGASNITLLKLPINLTAWRTSLNEAFERPLLRPLASKVATAVNNNLGFLANGSVNCIQQGEECIPGVPSCCSSGEKDLQCLPYGDVHRCGELTDTEELAQQRIDALEYGDSKGILESHPWVNDWEFQSKSEAEIEEIQAKEEADWKKHWKPSSKENFWLESFKKTKKEAIDLWKDLRKMKKLKEVKDTLTDKIHKRLESEVTPTEPEKAVSPEVGRVVYRDEPFEEKHSSAGETKTNSEESVIKFSDEVPKRQKDVNFRLDDIIKYALDLANKKQKNPSKQESKQTDYSAKPNLISEEEPLRLDEFQGTVDNLMKEINELKELKRQQEDSKHDRKGGILNIQDKASGSNIDELIKKQVASILEEERRIKKIQALKKLDILEHEKH